MHRPLLLLALTVSLNLCLAQLKSCFYYDRVYGSSGRDNFPCDPYANVSACCPGGFKCGTNLYCAEDDGGYDGFVGTCTDVTWKDPACPFVLNSDIGSINFNYTLNTTHCGGDHYCPGPDNGDCCNRGQWVSEISFSNENDLPTTAAGLSTYYEAGVYTASTTGLQFTQATTDGSMPQYATPSPTSSTPTATAPSTSALPGNTGRASLGPSASAGIGAGAAIGSCAAATLLYLLIKRRVGRRQRSLSDEGVATTQKESSWKTGLNAELAGMETDATPSEKVSELPAAESPANNTINGGAETAHSLVDGRSTKLLRRDFYQITDGQVQAVDPSAAVSPVLQITNGQVQAASTNPIAQITEGQVQAVTPSAIVTPVLQITDNQVQAASTSPIAQFTDGQILAVTAEPTVSAVRQFTNGGIQAVTSVQTVTPVMQNTNNHFQSDVPTSHAKSTALVPHSPITPSSSISSSSNANPAITPSAADPKLGEKAGIGVGAVVGACGIGVVIWVLMRRRGNGYGQHDGGGEQEGCAEPQPQYDGLGVPRELACVEMDTLPAMEKIHELPPAEDPPISCATQATSADRSLPYEMGTE